MNMELDELREVWAEHDKKLDQSIRLNRQLLRETYTKRARFVMWRLAATLALGSISYLVSIVWIGRFIYTFRAMPRFVWPAVVLDLAAIAGLAALNAQIGLALKIDYNQPVAAIQKRLELLRRFRIRYFQTIFLTVTLLWTPCFIVAMEGFVGIDVYRVFGIPWIVANVAFGLGVLALGMWLSKKYALWMIGWPFGQLDAAAGHLAALAEFEDDH